MHVRPVKRSDLSQIVDINTRAFADNEVDQWLNRSARKYPYSWSKYQSRIARARFVRQNLCGVVCVEPSAEDGEEVVLGCAWWRRVISPHDEKKDAVPWSYNDNNTSLLAAIERRLLDYETRCETYFQLNSAVDYGRRKQWDVWTRDEKCMDPLFAISHWWVESLSVAPEAQRRGIASMLLQWGKDMVMKESAARGVSIPVGLIASSAGSLLYPKNDFKIVAWAGTSFVEKMGFGGGQVFVWDPSETWVKNAPVGMVDSNDKPLGAVWTERTLQIADAGKK